jgi:hypothetical protein
MKCLICDKETKKGYSVDLDLPLLPYCSNHDLDVYMYIVLMKADGNLSPENWLKNARKTAKAKGSTKKTNAKRK